MNCTFMDLKHVLDDFYVVPEFQLGVRQILLNIRYAGIVLSTGFVANDRSSRATASQT